MPGICLTFDKKTKDKLNKIYKKINKKLNKDILKIDDNLEPHISLLRTKHDENINKHINSAIDKVSSKNKKYNSKLDGFGIFKINDTKFVLYHTIPNDENMQNIHKTLWKKLDGKIPDYERDLYHYSSFTPHVTIPIINSNKTTVLKVLDEMMKLLPKTINIKILNLTYLTANLKDPKIFYKKSLK
jgi:2'-5' RNA ligase